MRITIMLALATALAGCGPVPILPLQPNLNFNVSVPPVPAVFVNLDGQWVLAGTDGSRSCLVIQESRVSIIDLTCSSDGTGAAARMLDEPVISRAGSLITLSVSYNPNSFDTTQAQLTFAGTLQVDGTFVGTRHDVVTGVKKSQTSDTPAILSRS